MTTELIFIIIVVFLCGEFLIERVLDGLNMKAMSPVLPEKLKGIYQEDEYSRFQQYKKESNRLGLISSSFSFLIVLFFLCVKGFGWYNDLVISVTDNTLWQVLLFMAGLLLVSGILEIPFNWYATFKIEEKYGFNKMTPGLFIKDLIRNTFVSLLMGGLILIAITGFYLWAGNYFWLYAWGIITIFSIFISMFYSQLIVPLFNKQTPLKEGKLRDKIEAFASKTGFKIDNIYVMDGSKRSTKANAYFTGLGSKKRIVLYDTLIEELTDEEIVAVLAHEIGHYKKRHTLQFMVASIVQTGFMLWLLSLMVNRPELSRALGGDQAYFQLGLVAFTILYSPVSMILGLALNAWSRQNEYQADAYAVQNGVGDTLVDGLKKISVKSLSNLTPHPWYEFVYYSHPSLLKRIRAMETSGSSN